MANMLLKRIKDWATTITVFRTGDVIPVDGPLGTAKMSKDDLLREAAQNALADNMAPAFDPTRDADHKYLAGEKVVYNGIVKIFKVDHYGAWVDADAETIQMPEFFAQVVDFTNDNFLNSIIKELHFSNLTKAQVKSIDNVVVFKNYGGMYGLVFKAGNTVLSSMTRNSEITTDVLESSISDGGKAIVDFTFVKDGIHPVVRCTFTEKCLDYNFAPILKKGKWNESWNDFGLGKYLIFGDSAANPSDLNDLKESGVYVVQRTTATTTANFPSDFPTDASKATLEIYNNVFGTANVAVQVLSAVTGYDKWWRVYNSGTGNWSGWSKVSLPVFPSLAQYMEVEQYQLYGDYATNPADLNSLTDNCVLLIQRTAATTTANFPDGFPTDGSRHLLEVYQTTLNSSTKTAVQVLSSVVGMDKWWRVYNLSSGFWSAWAKVKTIQTNEFHVGYNYPYTTIRSAVEAATALNNSKVIIHNGTYDLLTEFADKFADLFSGTRIGLELKNGVHIFAHDGVKITANVPDDGTYTDEQLSKFGELFNPFYPTTNGSFTLENVNIEATNTRYCVHDEHGGSGTYYSKYINCKMKFSNTISRAGIAKFVSCIGGGLGLHGTIVVEGGRYESHTVNGAGHIGGGDPENHQNCISYHNGGASGCESSIRVSGVYLADRGYIKFGYYGTSTIKSLCEVSDCSLGLPLVIGKETNNGSSDSVNYDVQAWNNVQKVEGVHWEVGTDGYTHNLVND